MASIPFITRLRITCCSWIRSPNTGGTLAGKSIRIATPFSHRFILHQNDDLLNGLINVEAHFLCIGFLYERSNARE